MKRPDNLHPFDTVDAYCAGHRKGTAAERDRVLKRAADIAESAFDNRPRLRAESADWNDGYRDGTLAAAEAIRNAQDECDGAKRLRTFSWLHSDDVPEDVKDTAIAAVTAHMSQSDRNLTRLAGEAIMADRAAITRMSQREASIREAAQEVIDAFEGMEVGNHRREAIDALRASLASPTPSEIGWRQRQGGSE